MIRLGILLTALLIIMVSCESSKVTHFKQALDQSERKAFDIILGKEGSGEKKLEYLEKDNYKDAMKAVDQQAREFDALIADIRKLSTDGIPNGESLKTAYLAYYQSLKELHFFDKKEIEQQELLQTLKDNELKNAQNKLIELARQKKKFYNAVYEKENLLYTATKDFETANGF